MSVSRNRRLVNFVDCAFRLGWCAKRTRGCILVRTERPYVQWRAVRVTCTSVCSRGYKQSREGRAPKSLWVEVEWVLASPGELQKTVAVFHDPPVNVTGPGSCAPILSAALRDLTLKLSAFFLQPAACFLELMLPCLQLLYQWSSQLWWG
jgi:hypothetical protein